MSGTTNQQYVTLARSFIRRVEAYTYANYKPTRMTRQSDKRTPANKQLLRRTVQRVLHYSQRETAGRPIGVAWSMFCFINSGGWWCCIRVQVGDQDSGGPPVVHTTCDPSLLPLLVAVSTVLLRCAPSPASVQSLDHRCCLSAGLVVREAQLNRVSPRIKLLPFQVADRGGAFNRLAAGYDRPLRRPAVLPYPTPPVSLPSRLDRPSRFGTKD
jgi:hypothetical protein